MWAELRKAIIFLIQRLVCCQITRTINNRSRTHRTSSPPDMISKSILDRWNPIGALIRAAPCVGKSLTTMKQKNTRKSKQKNHMGSVSHAAVASAPHRCRTRGSCWGIHQLQDHEDLLCSSLLPPLQPSLRNPSSNPTQFAHLHHTTHPCTVVAAPSAGGGAAPLL